MEIPDILRKLLEGAHVVELHGADCDHDHDADVSTWSQAGMLGQEDILKRRGYLADMAKARSEVEVLLAKLDAVKANAVAKKTEFWAYVREKYCLPAKANIRISEDYRIVMKPEKDTDR